VPKILDDVLAALPFTGTPALFDDIRPDLDRGDVRTALYGLLTMQAVGIRSNGWYRTDDVPVPGGTGSSRERPAPDTEHSPASGADKASGDHPTRTGAVNLRPGEPQTGDRAQFVAVLRSLSDALAGPEPLTEAQSTAASGAVAAAANLIERDAQ